MSEVAVSPAAVTGSVWLPRVVVSVSRFHRWGWWGESGAVVVLVATGMRCVACLRSVSMSRHILRESCHRPVVSRDLWSQSSGAILLRHGCTTRWVSSSLRSLFPEC